MQAPNVEIFAEGPAGPFLLLKFAPKGAFGSQSCGSFIRISSDEMKARGLGIVVDHLRSYEKNDRNDKSELDRMYGTPAHSRFHRAASRWTTGTSSDPSSEEGGGSCWERG